MHSRTTSWLAMGVLLAGGTAFACELKTWEILSDRALSALARTLIGDTPDQWIHAEGEHFILHGQVQRDVLLACQEAEYAFAESAAYVGEDRGTEKCHLFVIENEKTWARLLEAGSLRTDGLALYLDNTVYILRDDEDAFGPLKIPAEIMHLSFQRNLGGNCPLWLEEGLSDYAGWRIAKGWYRKRYRRILERTRVAIPHELLMSWDEIDDTTELPPETDRARAFSRQANRMFRTIAERLGDEALPNFIRAVCADGQAWQTALTHILQLTPQELEGLEQAARHWVVQEEKE